MKIKDVLQKAILSEKAHKLMEAGVYTFLVSEGTSKQDVAKAVSAQFPVTIKKVNFSRFAPKARRITGKQRTTFAGGGKKALVWLAPGQKIAMLSLKSETRAKGKEKKSQKSTVESRKN